MKQAYFTSILIYTWLRNQCFSAYTNCPPSYLQKYVFSSFPGFILFYAIYCTVRYLAILLVFRLLEGKEYDLFLSPSSVFPRREECGARPLGVVPGLIECCVRFWQGSQAWSRRAWARCGAQAFGISPSCQQEDPICVLTHILHLV